MSVLIRYRIGVSVVLRYFVVAIWLFIAHCGWAEVPTEIVIPPWGVGADTEDTYFQKLLTLVLAKTEATDGPALLKTFPERFSSIRFMADLKNNVTLDLLWYATSKQREEDLLPIRISLVKELNEYRVLLIRREDQAKFANIQTLKGLQAFTAGAGADWPSADILRKNGMPVTTVNNISLLFPMLKAKRFDYISRNIFEVWAEVKTFEKDDLVIENTLLFHGGVPIYFFVNKNNKKLADRIERGLKIAIADGSFDELFLSSPEFVQGNNMLLDKQRKVLILNKD